MTALLYLLLFFESPAKSPSFQKDFNWTFDYEENGVKRYKTDKDVEGMTPFKASMIMDIPWQRILMAIADNTRSHEWSPRLIKVDIHKRKKLKYIYSQYYRAPWPFQDRQLSMNGIIRRQDKTVEFIGTRNTNSDYFDNDFIPATVHLLHVSLTPQKKDKTKTTIIFIGDMGGWIPSWIANIVQESWPTNFLLALNKHAKSEKNKTSANYLHIKRSLSF